MKVPELLQLLDEIKESLNDLHIAYLFRNYTPNKQFQILEENIRKLEILEQIDNANPSEALKMLEYIGNYIIPTKSGSKFLKDFCAKDDLVIIKQALIKSQEQEKVLKVIKEKNIDVKRFRNCLSLVKDFRYEDYAKSTVIWKQYSDKKLTQEEFDLLKEVLCYEKKG